MHYLPSQLINSPNCCRQQETRRGASGLPFHSVEVLHWAWVKSATQGVVNEEEGDVTENVACNGRITGSNVPQRI